jgi:probable phosphoglycerate mutase
MSGNLFEGIAGSGEAAGWFTAHCDGGSRGNPGPAGFGAVIEDPEGRVAARLSEFLGKQTNNYAEYSGLVAVLKWAAGKGVKRLRVVSDSELMVKQMKGQYKVNNPGLRPLWEEARRLSRTLNAFEMSHTLRAGNAEADRLANEAMDRGMGKGRDQGTGNRDQGTAASPGNDRPAGAPARIRDQGPSQSTAQRSPGRDQGTTPSSNREIRVPQPGVAQPPKAQRQVLEGYVKDGVVHLLGGELPDGIFVKVIRE